jgi:uncharacterized protein YfbU (UPF0304 family)
MNQKIRTFETGATRDSDDNKLDFEGFLSPAVIQRYAEYMHRHRIQPNGELRDSDNWQKGIPIPQYMKSLYRHFMTIWTDHRKGTLAKSEEEICAVIFNAMGILHEVIKQNETANNKINKSRSRIYFEPD